MTTQQPLEETQNTPILYTDKLLNSRMTTNFVTIPQTTINYEILHQALSDYNQLKYVITKLEQHKDQGLHIHIIIVAKQQIKLKSLHNIIMSQEGTIKGSINYQKPQHIQKSINYLRKEETSIEDKPYLEWGEIPMSQGRPTNNNKEILDAITLAEQGNTTEALAQLKEIDPMKYLQYKETFKQNLLTENKTRKKYTPPDMSKQNVKLNPQQQQVWDLLQETPKQRRIIWVSGNPGCGKSFLFNYINTNHEYSMYNAGQTASIDNIAYGYDEEGVVAWDIPKSYNYNELGDSLASVIEKFSDFGQTITSKKYNGKTQQVLGHAIVFSNNPPLEQLSHRDVIHISLDKQQDSLSLIESQKDLTSLIESQQNKQKIDKQPDLLPNHTKTSHIDITYITIDNTKVYYKRKFTAGKYIYTTYSTMTDAMTERNKLNIDYLIKQN